jgi:uncharacterized protein (DUF3084 family)
MLRALVPQLLGGNALERMRLEHLAAQWARIEQYQGEIWATLRHEALAAKEAELLPLIADRDAWIAERERLIAKQAEWIADRDRWVLERDARIAADQTALALCREEKALLEVSTSYRLGRKLTAPVRWLRSWLARWQ